MEIAIKPVVKFYWNPACVSTQVFVTEESKTKPGCYNFAPVVRTGVRGFKASVPGRSLTFNPKGLDVKICIYNARNCRDQSYIYTQSNPDQCVRYLDIWNTMEDKTPADIFSFKVISKDEPCKASEEVKMTLQKEVIKHAAESIKRPIILAIEEADSSSSDGDLAESDAAAPAAPAGEAEDFIITVSNPKARSRNNPRAKEIQ